MPPVTVAADDVVGWLMLLLLIVPPPCPKGCSLVWFAELDAFGVVALDAVELQPEPLTLLRSRNPDEETMA